VRHSIISPDALLRIFPIISRRAVAILAAARARGL